MVGFGLKKKSAIFYKHFTLLNKQGVCPHQMGGLFAQQKEWPWV